MQAIVQAMHCKATLECGITRVSHGMSVVSAKMLHIKKNTFEHIKSNLCCKFLSHVYLSSQCVAQKNKPQNPTLLILSIHWTFRSPPTFKLYRMFSAVPQEHNTEAGMGRTPTPPLQKPITSLFWQLDVYTPSKPQVTG